LLAQPGSLRRRTVRQRIGITLFIAGAVGTVYWGVGAVLIVNDLAIGATAPDYVPWLVAGILPVTIAAAGALLYGRIPRVTPQTGCLGSAWGVGLFLFIGGVWGTLDGIKNLRLSGPSYQAEASAVALALVIELVLGTAVTAAVGLWRREWFPTLVATATLMCVIGLLDLLLFTGAFSAM
jgi:hypothetical protein